MAIDGLYVFSSGNLGIDLSKIVIGRFDLFTETDECTAMTHNCGAGTCENTPPGSYTCTCPNGYTGSGTTMCTGQI